MNPVSTAWNTGIGTDPTPLTVDFTNWIPTPNSALLITLNPPTDVNEVGEDHTVTATILDGQGQGVDGIDVTFEIISGPNAGDSGTDTTDSDGEATFTYTGDGGSGTDVIHACYFTDNDPVNGSKVCSQTVTKVWNIVSDLGITLDPPYDLNLVGDDHTVTATVTDSGSPEEGVEVTFTVISGPNTGDTDTDTTDANGEATFAYTGDGGVGTDLIQACFGDPEICSNIVEKEWAEEGIIVTSLFASNPVFTDHTITAFITDSMGTPLPGIDVTFTVIAGPNTGETDTVTTDANGEAMFTYTGDGGAGMDEIEACFTNMADEVVCEELAFKEWVETVPVPLLNDMGKFVIALFLFAAGLWVLMRKRRLQ